MDSMMSYSLVQLLLYINIFELDGHRTFFFTVKALG